MKKTISTLLLIVAVLSANAQNWNQVIKACASDRAAGDYFGFSVAISGDYAIVGAYQEDHDASGGATLASAAYIFKNCYSEINVTGNSVSIAAGDNIPELTFIGDNPDIALNH